MSAFLCDSLSFPAKGYCMDINSTYSLSSAGIWSDTDFSFFISSVVVTCLWYFWAGAAVSVVPTHTLFIHARYGLYNYLPGNIWTFPWTNCNRIM